MSRSYRKVAVFMLAFVLLASVAVITGCSSDEADPVSDEATEQPAEQPVETPETESPEPVASGEEIVEGACSQCHDAARVFVQPYAVDWSSIVDEMNDAHGAALTDEEKAAVVEFLGSRELSAGEGVVAEKCGTCHDAQRIYEQGDAADWAAIVQQMTEVHGAQLTDEEKAAAVEFLEGL